MVTKCLMFWKKCFCIREKEIEPHECSIRKPSSSCSLASTKMCAHAPMNVLLCSETCAHISMNGLLLNNTFIHISMNGHGYLQCFWVGLCLSWSHMTVSLFKQLVRLTLAKAQYLVFGLVT